MIWQGSGSWLAVGGANLDIKGEPIYPLCVGTSNPGIVHTSPGGVARNVADNLARLGEDVVLTALVGEDSDGEWLKQITAQSGVSTVGMVRLPKQRTGRYISIHNEQGEMVAAIADMEINEAWDEQHKRMGLEFLKKASGLFLDANLPVSVIDYFLSAAKEQCCMIVVDPVSVKKAEKWVGRLHGINMIAPSRDEAAVLSGMEINNRQDVERAAELLHEQGVQQVFITVGSDGVYIHHPQLQKWLPAPTADVLDVTGAGDAFTAGVMYGMTRTDSPIHQAAYGLAMARFALGSKKSIAELVDCKRLEQAKEDYLREIRYES